jgi:hypothetical protein
VGQAASVNAEFRARSQVDVVALPPIDGRVVRPVVLPRVLSDSVRRAPRAARTALGVSAQIVHWFIKNTILSISMISPTPPLLSDIHLYVHSAPPNLLHYIT